MAEKFKILMSVCLGIIATFAKQYGILLVLVIMAIMFDVITGLIKAKIKGEISSIKGTKGFFKKIALLVCLFFGFFLDVAIPEMCEQLHFTLGFKTPFGLIIAFYIVINECISVCENLYECDPDIMPRWIQNILVSAKDKIKEEKNEDSKEE